ncbi:MAG TPA: TetR/AcrR family transcriptional regulator [Cellulomonas sp.]
MSRTARMSGEQRREQILAAALAAFAEGGYAGTSTDQVARAAGVSQPYVVRLFGSKRQLFLELYRDVADRILATMRAVVPEAGVDAADGAQRMGDAYIGLMGGDRDLLRVLMHGFIASGDPEIGRIARHTLGEVFRLFRGRVVGADDAARDDAARDFVSIGMLINVLLAVDAVGHRGEDAGLDALLVCVLGDDAPHALGGTGAVVAPGGLPEQAAASGPARRAEVAR